MCDIKVNSITPYTYVLHSIDIQSFIDNGLASKNDLIKVLGDGEIKTAIKITAHKFSKSAKAQIEKSGGEAIII